MRAPKTFDDLRAEIARRYGRLPARLQQIAEFALHHPNDMALGTVANIAGRAGVQPSSIIRFANAFGFPGFSDMQMLFRSRLVAGASTYRERIATLHARAGDGRRGPGAAALLAQFVRDGIGALEHLHDTISARDLDTAVRLMGRADQIYLLAQGRSFPVAFYLHYALGRLDRRSILLDGIGGLTREEARLMSRTDVVIAISFKEYSQEVVAVTADCKARNVPVIAITDSPLSPIARNAAVVFETGEDAIQPFRSLVAPICLAQTLVVAYGETLENRKTS
ncbi:MAG TPA: MurR/RpiR family transcriptional regulator [Alphaproteobacteria bacterium]